MKKVAVLFADGFEESESLTIVDILRRGGMECLMVGVTGREMMGVHDINVRADVELREISADDMDMVVIPGGYVGVDALMHDMAALQLISDMNEKGKFVTAICAGPRVLDRAGVLDGKKYTCYPGQEEKIKEGTFEEAIVLRDGNLITSRGPATCYAFAYALLDALGGDSLAVKNKMVYFNAFDEASSHRETCPDSVKVPEKTRKVAVLMKEGYEEGETFSIVDIMRRLGIECTTFCFDEDLWVKGMQGMMIQADEKFGESIEEYDAVVLPGGRPGGPNLIADPQVMDLLKRWNETPGKILSALCFGTRALAAAGVIEGKHMTGYTGYDQFLIGAIFETKVAVADQNLVSSQGPATGYPFAFKLAEVLGYDPSIVRSRLMYDYAGGILG